MSSRYEREHWIQRSSTGQAQWDCSPWPAPVDDEVMSSEGEDYTPSLLHRRLHRARKTAAMKSASTGMIDFSDRQQAASVSSGSSSSSSSNISTPAKPCYRRGTSHRTYRTRSNSSVEAPLQDIITKRRHSRVQSMQEPAAAEKLHIDTILPVQLPPVNLRALSPVSVYPCHWWPAPSSDNEELKRSESTNSFLSASSDGSWHGDHGDEDPDKQLDDAIAKLSTSGRNSRMKNGLRLSTYDYDEDDDPLHRSPIGHWQSQHAFSVNEAAAESNDDERDEDEDDQEADEIKSHAGFFLSNLATFLLDDRSLGLPTPTQECRPAATTPTQRALSRSNSDTAFAGATSSISQLDAELSHLRQHRRLRAATEATQLLSAFRIESEGTNEQAEQRWAVIKLQSLWQWFLPNVDEQLEQDLFGYDRQHTLHSRSESLPSLTSTSTKDSLEVESEGEDDEDDNLRHPTHLLDQTKFYEISKPAKLSKSALPSKAFRRVASFASKDAPSPLWDNRVAEEPYQRTWSSVLGLSSM